MNNSIFNKDGEKHWLYILKIYNLRNYRNQSIFIIIMSDSTSILDLPTDPVGGGSIGGNIALTAQENITQPNSFSIFISKDVEEFTFGDLLLS